MINNDVLRSLRYVLDVNDAEVARIIGLSGKTVDTADISAFLLREEDPNYSDCRDDVLAHFLDGLVVYRRGRDESRLPVPTDRFVSNNKILKKIRVAFELQDDDMHAILDSVGFAVSKPELSALFRKEGHKNFRACGDQLLRNFLKGLTLRMRG